MFSYLFSLVGVVTSSMLSEAALILGPPIGAHGCRMMLDLCHADPVKFHRLCNILFSGACSPYNYSDDLA